jgi:hypothetical protein
MFGGLCEVGLAGVVTAEAKAKGPHLVASYSEVEATELY